MTNTPLSEQSNDSNTASLELCKELYEWSEWDNTYLRWALFKEPRVVNADEWSKNMSSEPDLIVSGDYVYFEDHEGMLIPAYELSYVLKKMPMNIQIDESIGWLTLAENTEGWQCGYLMGGGYMENSLNFNANTPADAACQLAIELWKQGILNANTKGLST